MTLRILFFAVWSATTLVAAQGAPRKEYLQRGEHERDTYDRALRRLLPEAWREDVVLRAVVIASFQKEEVFGIRRVGNAYRAFSVCPTSQIWDQEVKRLSRKTPDFSKIRRIYKERPLTSELVERIASVWRAVINNSANYRDQGIVLDGTRVYFSVRARPAERIAAHAAIYADGSLSLHLFRTALALGSFAEGLPEAEFEKELRKAEKRVGVRPEHKRSNQSMKLTAGSLVASLPFVRTLPVLATRHPARRSLSPSR